MAVRSRKRASSRSRTARARSTRARSRPRSGSPRAGEPRRYAADCRKMAGESSCQMYMSGPMEDLIEAAAHHAIRVHGHEDTQELREQLRAMARPERR